MRHSAGLSNLNAHLRDNCELIMKIFSLTITLLLISVTSLQSGNIVAAENSSNRTQRGNINRMELDTLKIQGNKELPKVLFVVPWQEVKSSKDGKEEQGLVLHSLYGDLFDPVMPGSKVTVD